MAAHDLGLPKKSHSNNSIRNWIVRSINRGRVQLVVGAGLSFNFKCPQWWELGRSLSKTVFTQELDNPSWSPNTTQVEKILRDKFSNKTALLNQAVHIELYKNFNENFIKDCGKLPYLESIAFLVHRLVRKQKVSIISFNYDSLLEEFLLNRGLNCKSYYNFDYPSPDADVLIIHPHGFLPRPATDRHFKRKIILDQKSFNDDFFRDSFWSQYCKQSFQDNISILLGLSGDCANLDGLCISTNKRFAEISDNYWGLTFVPKENSDKIAHWEERGVLTLDSGEGYKAVPKEILDILKKTST